MSGKHKYLVTGGAGFIGSHIAEEALREGHEVIVVDDFSNGCMENVPDGARVYAMDVCGGDFQRMVESEQPRVIFHEAAQPSLRHSIEHPDEDAMVNVVGTIRVVQAAKRVGAHLLFASTSAVYSPTAKPPFFETDPHAPNLPYGIAKSAAELYIKHLGVNFTILRYGNVFGPRQAPVGENQLVPHCIRYLKGLEPEFVINGDGEQMRDFVYVKDIARANLMVRQRGVFNCGTGAGTTVNAVCEMLAWIAGKPADFVHGEAKPGEARHSFLSTHLIQETGWRARTRLEDGLRQTWAAYGTN